MSFSIYDLDENVRLYLNLDNFLSGQTVNDFIEELSKDHSLKGAEVNKLEYLDPKPYIRTFESTLRELMSLSEKASAQQKQGERDVEEYETKHTQTILNLQDDVEKTRLELASLEKLISDITKRISPLGISLTKITNSRNRSQHTIFLIRAYHGFFTKELYQPLDDMRKSSDAEQKRECATIVANLINLARKIESDESPRTKHCTSLIEKYGEAMERRLLSLFEQAYETSNFDVMREVAKILFLYNGGANVVQTFLRKNDLLTGTDSHESESSEPSLIDDQNIWIKLSDPNYLEPVRDEAAKAMLDRLRVAIKGQARIVRLVFEDHIPVLKTFIMQVYAQMIHGKISPLLQHSLSIGLLAHLRVLYALYTSVGDFTRDVKEFIATNDLDNDNELTATLDQSYYDLFIAYTSDSSFIAKERENLQEIIYKCVHQYNETHEKQIVLEALSLKVDTALNLQSRDQILRTPDHKPFNSKLLESKHVARFKSFMKNARSSDSANSSQQQHDLDTTVVETVLKLAIESVARLLELWPNKSPEYSMDVLEILLFDFGKFYINAGLEVAYDLLRQESSSFKIASTQTINFDFLKTLRTTSNIVFLTTSTVKKTLLPCAVNNPEVKSRMSSLTNDFVLRSEKALNIILTESNALIAQRGSFLLSKQRKRDFLCDTIEDDTEACELLSGFMANLYHQFSQVLEGTNLKTALVKVGMQLLSQLLEHYKKFTVNSTGGIVLTKDVIRYQSVIDEWGVPELSESFQLLREIGNLFTVQSELISSLVSEGKLATLKQFTVRQYVTKRADFNPSYIERLFNFK